jgi:signal-induced proliferation-associated 1 like protein 1
MVDLLKTSAQVTVTVIESFADYSPRRGCYLQNCKFNAINYEADYDQIDRNNHHEKGGGGGGNGGPGGKKSTTTPQHQQPSIVNHRRRYERNFSPPRSSNSSGYGTGSSSRSFQTLNPAAAHETRYIPEMGTLTSSSSGHSSNDDRWYDVLEPPTNDNTNNGSQGQTGPNENHVNNTSGQIYQHPKLQPSHSLPLSSATTNRALSVHDPTTRPSPRQANIEYLVTRAPKIKDYVDSEALLKNLHITENNNNNIIANVAMVESLYSTTKKIAPICTTDEEDLNNDMPHPDCTVAALKRSATTNNIYGTKKTNGGGTVSSSASSSRNNSPRPITEAKLRAGITNRSINYQQRNSVNYTGSSSLMEDLKKLIDLDYSAASDDNFHNGNLPKPQKNVPNSHSLGNISSLSSLTPALQTEDLILMKNKSRSREGINLGSGQLITKNNGHTKGHNEDDHSEVIFTTARPATVVSTSSSPAKEMIIHNINNNNNNNSKLHINEEKLKQSPRKQQMGASIRNGVGGLVNQSNSKLPLLPDIKDMDWTTLVDTATRAMLQSQGHHGVNNIDDHSKSSSANIYEELNGIEQSVNHHRATPPSQNMSEAPTPHSLSPSSSQNSTNSSHSNLMMPSSATMPELHNQVNQLSDRVLRETRRRKSLEHAVRRLTEENRRLQDESQAAVQQLRRFTEWLFQSNFMTK